MMLFSFIKVLRWCAALGIKFFSVVSVNTLSIVFFTLLSQVSTLLAAFMPLKVVILLGSEGVPGYFPDFLAALDRDMVIAGLSAATLAFFVIHLLSERLINWATGLGVKQLLERSHKVVLFENQGQIAAGGYHRYSRALASGVFIGLSLSCLGWFYPEVALVILGYVVLVFYVLCLLHRHSPAVREKLETSLLDVLNVVSGVGFFVAFGYLVLDFILWEAPSVVIVIVTLILSRQMMVKATGLVLDLAALYQQRVKLDALFFHGKVLLSDTVQHERSIWPLLQCHVRQNWVRAVLAELTSDNEIHISCKWHQTGQSNVAALKVDAGSRCYLVKLFEKNRSSLALHEATLLGDSIPTLPAPRLVGATQVQKFHCLVYELPIGHSPEMNKVTPLIQPLRSQLMAVEPPSQLCHRYQRSRPMLWQRLNAELIERLRIAVTSEAQRSMLDSLAEDMTRLGAMLQALPLVFHQPDLTQDAIWVAEEGAPLALNWGQWSLEPIGAGWPEGEAGLSQLESSIEKASEIRPALYRVPINAVELSALSFALERECNRQRYVQALELLPRLLERIAIMEPIARPGATNAG